MKTADLYDAASGFTIETPNSRWRQVRFHEWRPLQLVRIKPRTAGIYVIGLLESDNQVRPFYIGSAICLNERLNHYRKGYGNGSDSLFRLFNQVDRSRLYVSTTATRAYAPTEAARLMGRSMMEHERLEEILIRSAPFPLVNHQHNPNKQGVEALVAQILARGKQSAPPVHAKPVEQIEVQPPTQPDPLCDLEQEQLRFTAAIQQARCLSEEVMADLRKGSIWFWLFGGKRRALAKLDEIRKADQEALHRCAVIKGHLDTLQEMVKDAAVSGYR